MQKLKITIEDLKSNLAAAGYSPEPLVLLHRVVERYKCGNKNLVCLSYSNAQNLLIFGVCGQCGAVYYFKELSDVFSNVAGILETRRKEKAA